MTRSREQTRRKGRKRELGEDRETDDKEGKEEHDDEVGEKDQGMALKDDDDARDLRPDDARGDAAKVDAGEESHARLRVAAKDVVDDADRKGDDANDHVDLLYQLCVESMAPRAQPKHGVDKQHEEEDGGKDMSPDVPCLRVCWSESRRRALSERAKEGKERKEGRKQTSLCMRKMLFTHRRSEKRGLYPWMMKGLILMKAGASCTVQRRNTSSVLSSSLWRFGFIATQKTENG